MELTNALNNANNLLKDNAYALIPYILGLLAVVIVLIFLIKAIQFGIKVVSNEISERKGDEFRHMKRRRFKGDL